MSGNDSFYIVRSDALPDVFKKVLAAKEMLSSGKVKSTSEAAAAAGISRSAFYKYRDSVFRQSSDGVQAIATIQATLTDKPGVLSRLLSGLHRYGANILTVNQNIPSMGTALVTVSFKTDGLSADVSAVLASLAEEHGIIDVRRILER